MIVYDDEWFGCVGVLELFEVEFYDDDVCDFVVVLYGL